MTIRDEIAVLELLRQREAELIRVWQCEDGIRRILGLDYCPFEGNPELPSRRRGKRTMTLKTLRKSASAASTAGKSSAASSGISRPKAIQLRKLAPGEDAYRVVYHRHDDNEVSFQTDGELLKKLFLLEHDGFRVLSIETVRFRTVEDWDSLAVLWRRDDDGEAENPVDSKDT